jgi:DNA repair exonuclease SbcCD nuclease subunit
LLLFSDLHLDTPFRWASPQVARRRRQALRDTLRAIRTLALSQGVDALLCAGDLYEHDRTAADTGAFLRSEFAAVDPLPVFLAPGNHDWYGPDSLYQQVEWSPNVYVFTEDKLAPVSLAQGFTLWGAAHRHPANTDGFLDGFQVDRGGVNLALFHGSEQTLLPYQESGKKPHAPFRAEQIAAAGLHHALVGHFHTPRQAQEYTYPGNPDPLTFGESGERGAVIVEVATDGSVTRQVHKVAVSQVHDITVSLDGVEHNDQVRERIAGALAPLSGCVRLTLTGEVSPEVNVRLEHLGELAPHLEAVIPKLGGLRASYDLAALAQEQTVRGRFVRDVQADRGLDAELRRRILITGLRAFDGRADELEVR